MKYPKLTIFLGLLLALVAWVLVAGIEGDRPKAELAPICRFARCGLSAGHWRHARHRP